MSEVATIAMHKPLAEASDFRRLYDEHGADFSDGGSSWRFTGLVHVPQNPGGSSGPLTDRGGPGEPPCQETVR